MKQAEREQALTAHREALAACRRCPEFVAPHVRPIASLARAPRAMLVGQAPGQTEASGEKAFAGRAGATLFKWLARAGVDERTFRERVLISAITRCYPGASPSGRGDRVPSPAERARCGDWLAAELRIVRPPLLILVGRLAIDRFLGAAPLARLIGRAHEITHEGGTSVAVPLPHPSGASSWIHAPGHGSLLERALSVLGEELRRCRVAPPARSERSPATSKAGSPGMSQSAA